MRIIVPSALALLGWIFSPLAHSAESLDEYIASLHSELRMTRESWSPKSTTDKPPSLDVHRLLQHSRSIIHSATPAQRQQLSNAFIALVEKYGVPLSVSPVPYPGEYLGFTEVQVIYSEILDRGTLVQLATRAMGDKETVDALVQRSCSAPSIVDFQRRVLENDIDADRFGAAGAAQARSLSVRLANRVDWYVSGADLATCRDFSQVRVAPWIAR